MADRVQLPKDKHLAELVVNADADKHRREMGKIGQFFGSKDNATVYLAEILVVVALVAGAIIAYLDSTLRADAMKGIFAIGTLALGYMFGAGGKRAD
jgi:hypothetical protein